jgi:CIC family chloride channel protein
MMGASLQAPLAALMAILELTANPNTMLPGMVAVITAFLVARVVFRQDPMFVSILRSRGMDFRFDPVAQALERTGVGAVMSRRYAVVERNADAAALDRALVGRPDWLVVVDGDAVVGVLAAGALGLSGEDETGSAEGPGAQAAPLALPGKLPAFATVALHATLREARAALDDRRAEAVLVCGGAARRNQVYGVIGRQDIDSGARNGF